MEWISVNERLPDEFESVLACARLDGDTKYSVGEAFWSRGWSSVRTYDALDDVTHWMPLPPLPDVLQPNQFTEQQNVQKEQL